MWKYQELLNQNIQILFMLVLGAGAIFMKIFEKKDIAVLNRLVFNFLLPSSVLFALGLGTDLREGATWRFVGAFLLLRTFALTGSIAIFGIELWRTGAGSALGVVTVNWLFFSWISTVILGIPLLTAALGPQYASLGAVAAISSFIFQLPVMLVLFEISSNIRDREFCEEENGKADPEAPPSVDHAHDVAGVRQNSTQQSNGSALLKGSDSTSSASTSPCPVVAPTTLLLSKAQWRDIGKRIATNPILWAILVGFILSITTLGPKYMFPGNPPAKPNCSYEPATGFFAIIWKTLAGCTEPIALFATGAFLYGCNPLKIGIVRVFLYMLVKLILMPALAIGCAMAVGLEGAYGRAAVLIAALPISAAGFVLSSRYKVGQNEAISNMFFGNLLVLPTTLLWMVFMDAVDLFPTPDATTVDYCSTTSASGN